MINETKIPLKRVLGLGAVILLVIGNIIGSGVFKKIVPMAQTGLSEKWILCAWIVAGIIILCGAFSVAGLTKLTTEAGGQYEYLRLCFGDFFSFLFGWGYFIIMGSGSIAALAFIFSQSINSLIAIPNPLYHWQNISIGNFIFPFASSGIKILAIAVVAALTWINYLGIKKGAIINNIVTCAKVAGILFLVFLGLIFSPFPTDNYVLHNTIGPGGILFFSAFFAALLSAFWAYDGFANMPSVAAEIKNPKRNIPIALITGVCVVITLYVLTNFAYMQSMSLQQLSSLGQNKVAAIVMAGNIIGKYGAILISLLIIFSTFGALNVIIIFYSRYYYKMAEEKMFFKNVGRVHPVHRTPYVALVISMLWSCVLIISGTFDLLTDMVIFSEFIFYALLAIGLIKMKRKKVIREKVSAYPAAPVIFILITIGLLINTFITQPRLSLIGLALILTGVPLYFYFKTGKTKLIAESGKQKAES